MMGTTSAERIQTILDELGINQVELGGIAKASKSVVNQWLSGKIKSVAPEYAFAIQREKGYNAEWIMLGTGRKMLVERQSRRQLTAERQAFTDPRMKRVQSERQAFTKRKTKT